MLERFVLGAILLFLAGGIAITGDEIGRCIIVAILTAVGATLIPEKGILFSIGKNRKG